MTKLVALIALLVLALLTMLGNYWFTYGLWPRSWASFVVFGIANLLIVAAMEAVKKDRE